MQAEVLVVPEQEQYPNHEMGIDSPIFGSEDAKDIQQGWDEVEEGLAHAKLNAPPEPDVRVRGMEFRDEDGNPISHEEWLDLLDDGSGPLEPSGFQGESALYLADATMDVLTPIIRKSPTNDIPYYGEILEEALMADDGEDEAEELLKHL